MTLPGRIYRLARHHVRRRLGLVQGTGFRIADPAREELEQCLREAAQALRARARRAAGAGPAAPGATVPPEPAPHPLAREYALLGVPIGADLPTVRASWRRIVREIHPDRYAHDPGAQRRAAECLRRVNDAYDRLRAHLGG